MEEPTLSSTIDTSSDAPVDGDTFQGTLNPIAHEQSFHDVLMRVMGAALRPADNVESYLVGPLLEFFCSWPLSVLLLHAEMALPQQQFQVSYCSGATAETPETSNVLKGDAIQELLLTLESATEREARLKQIIAVMSQPDSPRMSSPKLFSSKGLVLWDAVRRKNGTLHIQEIWVIFEATIPPDPERLSWFFEKRTSRETLRLNLLALRAQRLIPELSQEIKALQGAENERLVDRLKRAEDILQILLLEQAFHGPQAGYLGLAEDIGVWVVQLILGAGWVRRDFGGSLGRNRLLNIASVLSEMYEYADTQCTVEAERLRCISSLLQGLLNPRQEQAPLPNSDWQQLAIWTRLYELSRMAAQEGGDLSATTQALWLAQGHQSLRWLAGLLASRAPDGKQNHFGGDDLADSRNWLRLWFCHQLLGRVLSTPDLRATGTLRRQLQADLAYVLRECIRLRLFGRRPDYSFQPSEFAAALRTLIEYHSVYEVGLSPSHDIARLLYEIADPQRPDQQAFAAAHLQHVLEMYIAGHFFCALEVLDPEQPEEQWTLGAMLAARDRLDRVPGPQTIADFRQAFSLAVLFHDVGLLLFPDLTPAAHPIYRDDRHLLGAQRAVQDTLMQAGRDLLNRCTDELRRAGWIDLNQDPDLARWLEEQLDRGDPDHAILGAWYLHCTCRNVVGVNPEVVRDAVRAILLHGVPTRPILLDGDAQETDPVAALLVLCDEMLDWLPLLVSGPAANTIGRSRHSLAADPRAYRSRARRLGLPQLQVQAEGESLRLSLSLDAKARAEGWPTVDIVLEPKEFQDVPIYQTWLSTTQNLQRIRRSPTGWGPVIRIFGEIPAQLRDSRIPGTRMLLEQVVRSIHARQLPFTASLEAWLSDDQRFPELAPEFAQRLREQCMMIRPEGKAFYTRDIRTWFPQMLEIVNRVLADTAARQRQG